MYCSKCGQELTGNAAYCPKCGTAVIQQAAAVSAQPISEVSGGKNKTASILLAVFLSFWTWLYTYKKDNWKFWVGLVLNIFAIPLAVIIGILTFGIGAILVIAPAGVWVWAIVDVSIKPDTWYSLF